ncbi:MAG: DNA polymerase III subunit delta' [Planctomycetota bacterium]
MRFSDVQHQDRALSILRRALRSGRTHHAYLLEGPEGVGKELAARALAARLLCEAETRPLDADACGDCRACRLLAAGNHPDFHLIHRGLHKFHPDRVIRGGKGLFLVVDLIRQFLIEPAAMKPAQGRRRVFIIRDAERMNEQAQNALLKTLEEPPGAAVLILITSSATRLLPTIRSRCQVVPFQHLPAVFVSAQLVGRAGLAPPDAAALAGLSEGRLGIALRWHQMGLRAAIAEVGRALGGLHERNPEVFAKTLIDLATELAQRARQVGDEPGAEPEAADATEDVDSEPQAGRSSAKAVPTDELRDALKLVLLLVAAFHRDALLEQLRSAAPRFVPGERTQVAALSAMGSGRLDTCLRAVAEAERMLDRNVAPQLAGEHLAVALMGELPVLGQ